MKLSIERIRDELRIRHSFCDEMLKACPDDDIIKGKKAAFNEMAHWIDWWIEKQGKQEDSE